MPENTASATALILHDSFLAWPNGGGETPCTLEFANLQTELDATHDELREISGDENYALEDQLEAKASELQMRMHDLREQGHVGEPLPYDRPCAMTALLGGASMDSHGGVWHNGQRVGTLERNANA